MKKLQFKTNSRHISQLGRELVTDFVTALVELIKNSYDADAYGVKIILDKPNTPQSRIVLIDTGTGMTQSDFENKWMVIGTNNKITEPYTPKGRKKAGKKGIGRFSVERLAEKVQIYSFPEFEPPYRVDINWNSFEEINIPALTQRIGILKDHQESTAAKFICNQLEYFMVTDKILQEDKDTVESILGTKSFEYPMFYKNETLRLLEDKVVPIIKKYEDIELLIGDVSSSLDTIDSQSESEVFTMLEELYIKFNLSKSQTGMILIMEGLRDEWKQRDIDKLQKELRLLVAPDFIESDPFKIELVAPEFKVEDIVLVNEILDLRYAKIDAEIFDNAQKSRITYSDNGMDINQIKDVVSIVSGDFDRIYAYSNLIVNFLRKRKRTIDSEINLSSALKEVGGFYQTIVKSFDITLNFVCEDTIEYKIKQIDFESIVINMITNAFEQVKGRENRKITVTISQSASHLIIYFEDSGAGVPEGKEKEIFRPFETTKENGIGLGLNIVKDIVEKYHGDISVKRSETMLGAKFIVTLPKGDE